MGPKGNGDMQAAKRYADLSVMGVRVGVAFGLIDRY